MGYKVYTYANPFKLNEAHFWDDIKGYPHICSSQVLAEGLKSLYNRDFAPFIYTIEAILGKIYPSWYQDVEFKISQFVKVSAEIDSLSIEDRFKKSLKFNINDLIDSIRFIQELNIYPSEIESAKVSREQGLLVELYQSLLNKDNDYFQIKEKADLQVLKNAFIELITEEIDKKEVDILRNLEERVDRLKSQGISGIKLRKISKALEDQHKKVDFLENVKETWSNPLFDNFKNLNKIVIHGIHRFNPMIVRFITELENLYMANNMELEVIFLYNLEPNFPEVYETWKTVYNQWNEIKLIKTEEHDKNHPNYEKDYFDLNEKSIGESIGNLIEGRFDEIKHENIDFIEFDNNTCICQSKNPLNFN